MPSYACVCVRVCVRACVRNVRAPLNPSQEGGGRREAAGVRHRASRQQEVPGVHYVPGRETF